MIKHAIKRSLQIMLATVGQQQWRLPRKRLLVLMYHRILPTNHPELDIVQPGMAVYPETFSMHLRVLKQLFEVVRLDEWLKHTQSGMAVPAKACAITFDDGWRDNFYYAAPILQKEQVPATIFLVSDMIDTQQSFWPERLARLLWANGKGLTSSIWKLTEFSWLPRLGVSYSFAGGTPQREEIDEIIGKAKTLPDSELEARVSRMEARVERFQPDDGADLLGWEQVRAMQASGLIDFGSHTRRHRRMNQLTDKQSLVDEIHGSKEIIEKKAGISVNTFCYPNGDVTPDALQIVRNDYIGACTTASGWNSPQTDPYLLKRIGIHQDIAWDRTAFMARLSGWF